MSLWLTLALNSISMGGLLFLLSAGFSLIFGLMRIPNLMHGSFFMLGAYFGVTLLNKQVNFWIAALISGAAMAVIGIRVSRLCTLVFALGAGLAAFAGVIGAPYLSVYPGQDSEMLPLALIVVILGGSGSLPGALVGSFVIGFLYNFGQALLPDLAYVILFLPMVLVLVLRPQGLSGRAAP